MRVGDLIKVRVEWEFCYPRYKGVIGLIVEIKILRNGKRIRWLHSKVLGVEYTVMPHDVLEVI